MWDLDMIIKHVKWVTLNAQACPQKKFDEKDLFGIWFP